MDASSDDKIADEVVLVQKFSAFDPQNINCRLMSDCPNCANTDNKPASSTILRIFSCLFLHLFLTVTAKHALVIIFKVNQIFEDLLLYHRFRIYGDRDLLHFSRFQNNKLLFLSTIFLQVLQLHSSSSSKEPAGANLAYFQSRPDNR